MYLILTDYHSCIPYISSICYTSLFFYNIHLSCRLLRIIVTDGIFFIFNNRFLLYMAPTYFPQHTGGSGVEILVQSIQYTKTKHDVDANYRYWNLDYVNLYSLTYIYEAFHAVSNNGLKVDHSRKNWNFVKFYNYLKKKSSVNFFWILTVRNRMVCLIYYIDTHDSSRDLGCFPQQTSQMQRIQSFTNFTKLYQKFSSIVFLIVSSLFISINFHHFME